MPETKQQAAYSKALSLEAAIGEYRALGPTESEKGYAAAEHAHAAANAMRDICPECEPSDPGDPPPPPPGS